MASPTVFASKLRTVWNWLASWSKLIVNIIILCICKCWVFVCVSIMVFCCGVSKLMVHISVIIIIKNHSMLIDFFILFFLRLPHFCITAHCCKSKTLNQALNIELEIDYTKVPDILENSSNNISFLWCVLGTPLHLENHD